MIYVQRIPVDVCITSWNKYDSLILADQLNNINNKILLGDAGYDSNVIRNILQTKFNSQLICHRNKRNTKNPIKLAKMKLTTNEIKYLKKWIKVEHLFSHLKAYKRISLRYDKYMCNYTQFVLLTSLDIINENIK